MTDGTAPQLRSPEPARDGGRAGFFLRRLPAAARQALEDAGRYVELPKGKTIFGPDLPPDCVYFPSAGVAAIVAQTGDGRSTGSALIGPEGYLTPASILGADRVANRCLMMAAGRGLRVGRDALLALQQQDPQLQKALLGFAYVMITQMIATSLSHSAGSIPKRLVRLILMMYDRLASEEIPLSHAECAALLGVRRASVTDAMHVLEGEHLISNARGIVSIVNRAALLRLAGKTYGGPEGEYNRLIGPYF